MAASKASRSVPLDLGWMWLAGSWLGGRHRGARGAEGGGGIRSWRRVTAGTWALRGICATMARSPRTLCGSGVASPAAAGPAGGRQAGLRCGADWCAGVGGTGCGVVKSAVDAVDSMEVRSVSVTANRSCISACGPRGGSQPRLARAARSARVGRRDPCASGWELWPMVRVEQGHCRWTRVQVAGALVG